MILACCSYVYTDGIILGIVMNNRDGKSWGVSQILSSITFDTNNIFDAGKSYLGGGKMTTIF